MKYDWYSFYGDTGPFATSLGKPIKQTRRKALAMKAVGYVIVKVSEGSSLEAVILQAMINQGSHPRSWNCAKAFEEHLGIKISFEDIHDERQK